MADVIARKNGRAGHITLSRPQVLNAVTTDMVLAIEAALDAWRADDAIDLILIDSDLDKAFSAGGDVVALYRAATSGDHRGCQAFWRNEYRLVSKIATYPKPYVAVMNGYIMGSGVALSVHGSHRIVTERTAMAMPETAIGLYPDIGSTLMFGKAAGHIGEYLAMTGAQIGAGDAIYTELADRYVPAAALAELKQALFAGDVSVLDRFAIDAPDSGLRQNQAIIDACFGVPDAAAVVAALAAHPSPWAQNALTVVQNVAPLSAAVAFEGVRRARSLPDLDACLAVDFRILCRAAAQMDFFEGVRALLVDKDRAPRWRHTDIAQVTRAEIENLFTDIGAQSLVMQDRVGQTGA